MSGRLQFAFVILVVSGMLFVAFRYGLIGGGGGVTYRKEHPIPFWIGVVLNVFMLVVAVLAVVGSFVSPDRFHLD